MALKINSINKIGKYNHHELNIVFKSNAFGSQMCTLQTFH